jgi:hypothetical protein
MIYLLTMNIDGEWVEASNGGYYTNLEAAKKHEAYIKSRVPNRETKIRVIQPASMF